MKPAPIKTRTSKLGDTTLRNADGSTGLPTGGLAYEDTRVVDAPTSFGPEMAAKLAVAELLRNFAAYDVQVKAVLAGDTRPAQVIHLASGAVAINWPEQGSIEAPLKLTIREVGSFAYDDCGLSGPSILHDTVDKFGKGTVLQLEADCTGQVSVELEVAANARAARERLAAGDVRVGLDVHRSSLLCRPASAAGSWTMRLRGTCLRRRTGFGGGS